MAALPAGNVTVRFGAERLFFQAGVWFRPVGREFVVVTPPFGVVVPAQPPGCATLGQDAYRRAESAGLDGRGYTAR